MQVGWDEIRHFGPILAISQKRFKPWPTVISMQSCTSCIVSTYCDILVERKDYLTRKNVTIFLDPSLNRKYRTSSGLDTEAYITVRTAYIAARYKRSESTGARPIVTRRL